MTSLGADGHPRAWASEAMQQVPLGLAEEKEEVNVRDTFRH